MSATKRKRRWPTEVGRYNYDGVFQCGDKSEEGLRGEDVFGVGFDLDGGEAGGVPAAAEGFHQEDAGYQFLALQDGEFLFVG